MIRVRFDTEDGTFFSMYVEGHAQAERNSCDHDLVCCAVSTVVGALACSCMRIDDVNTTQHGGKGHALVTVTGVPEELWAEINARYQMARDALETLAEQYPNSLEVH